VILEQNIGQGKVIKSFII